MVPKHIAQPAAQRGQGVRTGLVNRAFDRGANVVDGPGMVARQEHRDRVNQRPPPARDLFT
jgi:hypothetical protein